MITTQTDLQTLFDLTIQKAASIVNSEEKFIVRDLWPAVEWKRLSVATRSQLGAMFFSYVKNNPGLYEPCEKTAQKQQIYIKL